jgi:hypothetical protein
MLPLYFITPTISFHLRIIHRQEIELFTSDIYWDYLLMLVEINVSYCSMTKKSLVSTIKE